MFHYMISSSTKQAKAPQMFKTLLKTQRKDLLIQYPTPTLTHTHTNVH